MRWNWQASRLYRLLAQHERDEADREALEGAAPEPPTRNDEQIDRLARLLSKESKPRFWTGTVNWYCPHCESLLQDSVDGWWCVTCEMGFSEAALAAADPESGEGF